MTNNVKALVFPGQGSQVVGMGKSLYDNSPVAKAVFEEINDIFGSKITDIAFNGPIENLTATQNSQTAIASVSIAVLEVLKQTFNINLVNTFKFTAGHSLGEYVALYASGVFSLKDTINLLKVRGQAMANAGSINKGGMCVILGVDDITKINELIEASKIANKICVIANDNSKGQVVLSGHLECIDSVVLKAKDFGIKAMKLPVSGAFHSPLMQSATQELELALASININTYTIPVVHNVLASINNNKLSVKDLLINQLTGSVRWRETMDYFANNSVSTLVECGQGTVLTGLIKRSYPDVARFNLQTLEDIEAFVKSL